MFSLFIMACYMYKFSFVLSTYGGLNLILRPDKTFKNIEIEERDYCYNRLFKKAIKEMREYRER